jgi:hypothetical protein
MESGKESSDEGGYPSAQAKNRARGAHRPRKSHRYSNSTDASRQKEKVKDKAKKSRQGIRLVRNGNESTKLGA